MPQKLIRLLGFGAFGVVVVLIAIAALIVWVTIPTPTTGITWAHTAVTWIAVAVVVFCLGAAHVVLGRQLLWLSKGDVRPV
jgi:hypothetical protein